MVIAIEPAYKGWEVRRLCGMTFADFWMVNDTN